MKNSQRKDFNKNVVVGQKTSSAKKQLAKELRKKMTTAEKILWNALRNNKLNGLHFRRQQIIDGLIVDFYCHEFGLVVEVDGGIHEFQLEYDNARDKTLESRNLRILRIKNEEVKSDLEGVLAKIKEKCNWL